VEIKLWWKNNTGIQDSPKTHILMLVSLFFFFLNFSLKLLLSQDIKV